MKETKNLHEIKPKYEDIHMPKNSPLGMLIGLFSLLFGFAIVWHILWLSLVGIFGIVITVIIRLSDDDTDYFIPAAEIAKIEGSKL